MSSSDTFVIVGAGMAGGKAAETLREEGFDGRVCHPGARGSGIAHQDPSGTREGLCKLISGWSRPRQPSERRGHASAPISTRRWS